MFEVCCIVLPYTTVSVCWMVVRAAMDHGMVGVNR